MLCAPARRDHRVTVLAASLQSGAICSDWALFISSHDFAHHAISKNAHEETPVSRMKLYGVADCICTKEAGPVDVQSRAQQWLYELRAESLRQNHDWLERYGQSGMRA